MQNLTALQLKKDYFDLTKLVAELSAEIEKYEIQLKKIINQITYNKKITDQKLKELRVKIDKINVKHNTTSFNLDRFRVLLSGCTDEITRRGINKMG